MFQLNVIDAQVTYGQINFTGQLRDSQCTSASPCHAICQQRDTLFNRVACVKFSGDTRGYCCCLRPETTACCASPGSNTITCATFN